MARSVFMAAMSAAEPFPFGALSSRAWASVSAVLASEIAWVASVLAFSFPAVASAVACSPAAFADAVKWQDEEVSRPQRGHTSTFFTAPRRLLFTRYKNQVFSK